MRNLEVAARAWRTIVFRSFLFLLVGTVSASSLHAQVVGGTIQGTVSDVSGAVVPEVKVSIRNLKTDNITTVVTNSSGFYAVPNLLPGAYELSATATGFSRALMKNVDVAVGDQLGLNLTLRPGMVSQNVEITATTTKVDLESSAISNQVNSTTVRELPLNGRDWTQLATLEPGVD
ncbi:MAG: TonB-dependent receptor plug [Acidobacteriaceae bacterium]|nr:TonB-dependent receptor plug [Acidobacteriaceae bacterium]